MSHRSPYDPRLLAFRAGYLVIAAFMLLPLLVVISTSLTESGYLHFPPDNPTLKWYQRFLESSRWMEAFKNSIIIAIGTMFLSTAMGVSAAVGLRGVTGKLRGIVVPLLLIPMLVPGVVLGVTLLMYFSRFNLQQTYIGVILAHTLWTAPLVFFIMQAVFSRFDWQIRDAAMDLGGRPIRVYLEVVFPGIKDGVIASALVAFILSLQEFLAALFLTGSDTVTVPVLAWNSLRQVLDPIVSVISTVMILSVIIVLIPASLVFGFRRLVRHL